MLSLFDWKEIAQNDPSDAARQLHAAYDRIPPEHAGAILAHRPSLAEHESAFAASVAQHADAPLAGVPFLLKDLYDFPGTQTTASSSFLATQRPDPSEESKLSADLRSHGGVFCGKTHLNEFAYGLSGENLHYGDCPHPHHPERLSGGSSSGSAWAVARGIVPLATGTDTGGSIRVPAAWCGLFGLRLPPSDWSTKGCFPLAPTIDTPGWFTRSAAEMRHVVHTLLGVTDSVSEKPLRGLDLLDSCPELGAATTDSARQRLSGFALSSDADALTEYLAATGEASTHYAVLQSIEAFQVHQSWLDTQKHCYDPAVWQRIDRGRNWEPAQIETAQRGEAAIVEFFKTALTDYDFLVLPVAQSPAIHPGEHTASYRTRLLGLNAPGSLTRSPILTVPLELPGREFQGVQIVMRDDAQLTALLDRVLRELD